MSIKAIDQVLDNTKYRGASRLVLIAIANHVDENGFAWPSLKTIAAEANISKRSAIRAIERLEDDGVLFVMRRRNAGNAYVYLTDDTRPRFRDAIDRLLNWTGLGISDILAFNLRQPSRKMLQMLTVAPAAISDICAEISDSSAAISDTESLESSGTVSEPNTPAQAQDKTPVSPAAVPSESGNGPIRSNAHHHTDAELQAFENEQFRLEMEGDSHRLNAQPQKHISAEERIAATRRASARGWANRSKGITRDAFEKALEKYGDDAPALREFHERLETEFGLVPNWESVSRVEQWCSGLKELYIAARGDASIASAAGKKLRKDGFPMSSPRSLLKTASSIAAERATAHTAPSARAVREYV